MSKYTHTLRVRERELDFLDWYRCENIKTSEHDTASRWRLKNLQQPRRRDSQVWKERTHQTSQWSSTTTICLFSHSTIHTAIDTFPFLFVVVCRLLEVSSFWWFFSFQVLKSFFSISLPLMLMMNKRIKKKNIQKGLIRTRVSLQFPHTQKLDGFSQGSKAFALLFAFSFIAIINITSTHTSMNSKTNMWEEIQWKRIVALITTFHHHSSAF